MSAPDWPSLCERDGRLRTLELVKQGDSYDHTGAHGHSQRAWRVNDADGTGEYAVSTGVAMALYRDAAHAFCLGFGWYIREQRHKNGEVSCALIDLDGMKEINGGPRPDRDHAIFALAAKVLDGIAATKGNA